MPPAEASVATQWGDGRRQDPTADERVLHSVPQARGSRLGRSSEDWRFKRGASYRRAGEVLNLSTTPNQLPERSPSATASRGSL